MVIYKNIQPNLLLFKEFSSALRFGGEKFRLVSSKYSLR